MKTVKQIIYIIIALLLLVNTPIAKGLSEDTAKGLSEDTNTEAKTEENLMRTQQLIGKVEKGVTALSK